MRSVVLRVLRGVRSMVLRVLRGVRSMVLRVLRVLGVGGAWC